MSRAIATRQRELTYFREAEKVGYNRLAAPILVRAVAMQPITTATSLQVNQGERQIVAAEEPGEYARCGCFPFEITIGAPCRKAGRDRRRGL
jgi:hypothetical protein